MADGEENPLYPVIEQAKQTLDTIGIMLNVQEVDGEKLLQKKLETGTQQIWVGSRAVEDMDLDARYGTAQKTNLFGIKDKNMKKAIDSLQGIMAWENRQAVYRQCFDTVLDWAVEVPVCEYQELTMFSSKRIDADTIAKDYTPYYGWLDEIQKVRMK